jgi:hypothetical protein
VKLARIICAPAGHVAATVERTKATTRMNEYSRVSIPAGTVVIVMQMTQSWAAEDEGTPTHRRLITRIPVDPTVRRESIEVPCQKQGCDAHPRVAFSDLAAAVIRAERNSKVQTIKPSPSTTL